MNQYPSGASSLFAIIARSEPVVTQEDDAPVTCPWCLSEETKVIDQEHGIYECTNCGETFGRPAG